LTVEDASLRHAKAFSTSEFSNAGIDHMRPKPFELALTNQPNTLEEGGSNPVETAHASVPRGSQDEHSNDKKEEPQKPPSQNKSQTALVLD